jgi:hypothetical protein
MQLEPLSIQWTDLAKKRILPLKGDGKARSINLKESIRLVKEEVQARVSRWSDPGGVALATPEDQALAQRLNDFCTEILADRPPTAQSCGIALRYLGWFSKSYKLNDLSDELVDLLFKQRGSAFLVEALIFSQPMTVRGVAYTTGPLFRVFRDPLAWKQPDLSSDRAMGWSTPGWVRARRNLAHAADYLAGLAAAASHRNGLSPERRLLLNFLFPDQADWAEEDASYFLAQEKIPDVAMILLCCRLKPETALALASRASPTFLSRMEIRSSFTPACTMLHILGLAGVEAVVKCQDSQVATLVPHPAFLSLLISLNGYGDEDKVVTEVVARYPLRAMLALAQALAECRAVSWKMRRDGVRIEAVLAQAVAADPARAWSLLPHLTEGALDELKALVSKQGPPPAELAPAESTAPVLLPEPFGLSPDSSVNLPLFAQGLSRHPPNFVDGTALPDPGGRNLALALCMNRSAWLKQALPMLESAGVDAFSWALFESWLGGGAPGEFDGAMKSLALTMSRAHIREFAGLLGEWASGGGAGYRRATAGLNVLRENGSDAALVCLLKLSEKVRSQGLRKAAEFVLGHIAQSRGYNQEELGDRLVPDLGLDAKGSMMLDFGSRQFTVGFDEALEPFVLDSDGKRARELPKPGKTDDASKAAAAASTWKELKKEVKELAGNQILRLERAMCEERRWKQELFIELLVRHPLMQQLVQRLLWGAWRGVELLAAFRVAEDGSFADLQDNALALPEGAVISLLHPLEIPNKPAWEQRFASYLILQPFPQLARSTFALALGDAVASELVRYRGKETIITKLLPLIRSTWQAARPEDNGYIFRIFRSFQGQNVTIELSPGYPVGSPLAEPRQTIHVYSLNNRSVNPFSAMSPISLSELLRDLEAL